MMAQPFPSHAGMAPGHPAMAHGHPMAGMQHPGVGPMAGQPGPGMMQGMHPGVSGPQVSGPMVTGMAPGGIPAHGNPMQNAHAMAHLGPGQQQMFQPHNQQMNFAGQMSQPTPQQQQVMVRQRHHQQMLQQMQIQQQHHQQQQHQQQQQQQHHSGMVGMMPQAGQFSQAQLQQIKGLTVQQQMQLQAQANANANAHQQNARNQHVSMMAQQQAQALVQNQQAQMQQQQRNAAAQQMQHSRSQEPVTQPPQSHPTSAPQSQPQPQATPQQQQQQPPPPKQQPDQPQNHAQPQQANSSISTQGDQQSSNADQQQNKEMELNNNMAALGMISLEHSSRGFQGQGILRLLSYADQLNRPIKPHDLEYWDEFVGSYFSPNGVVQQQLFNNKNRGDKKYQIQCASLARFFHAHFTSGIKQIIIQPVGCTEVPLPNGGVTVFTAEASFTYVFENGIKITTTGQITVNYDMVYRIEHLSINTNGWTELVPRNLLPSDEALDQKSSPSLNKKRQMTARPAHIPSSGVSEFGLPAYMIQFLEIAEVMMTMGPLMEYYQKHPGMKPQEAMQRMVVETAQNLQAQNRMAASMNGQIPMGPGQRTPGMNGPNQFNSPNLAHLGIPQGNMGSPHIGGPAHTPSPAQHGGIGMVHQMSQQGSNLSGSQGASTNTSPNVNKRRRASAVKLEDDVSKQEMNGAGPGRVKPSPKISGKRQKGTA